MRRDRAISLLLASWLCAAAVASSSVEARAATAMQSATVQPASSDSITSDAAKARDAGRLEEALELYRKALANRADWNEGRRYIETLLSELDRYVEAKDAFAEVLKREPTHAGALGLKGLCEFADAERERSEFTRLDPLVRAMRNGLPAVGGIPSAGPGRR